MKAINILICGCIQDFEGRLPSWMDIIIIIIIIIIIYYKLQTWM
jgi:hypothetical protein